MGIMFKPQDQQNNNLWLAGVEELDNNFQHDKQIDVAQENEMDINELHDVVNDPSEFHTPNKSYNAYISIMNQNPETQVMNKKNEIQIDHNREILLEIMIHLIMKCWIIYLTTQRKKLYLIMTR